MARIPAAAVSVEDAQAMARMQARGQNITLHLYMEGGGRAATHRHTARQGGRMMMMVVGGDGVVQARTCLRRCRITWWRS